ncbi:helix-turn-helix domain-containing protein [Sphingobacterium sp. UBA5670]|uniref:helix-turn-helix domain-containing protein n=1 Tax=Sphingobacterium sp. UBA5670 TaxID=1947502 RepID=UPI0025F5A8B8|nr:helix-turn-helix transcriptional regulator [Sphingobacterium sp. UBA5670]
MSKKESVLIRVNSIADYHEALQLPKPRHPLFSITDFSQNKPVHPSVETTFQLNLYCISVKEDAQCVLRYGPHQYDFREGLMTFFKPGQTISIDPTTTTAEVGYSLVFHPDFIRTYDLANKIGSYSFFDYEVNEALFLSDREKEQIRNIGKGILSEYDSPIDSYSQDAIVSFIDLLLVYSQRFYNRQFITRKVHNVPLVSRFEQLLDEYINDETGRSGLPQVGYFAGRLNMSKNYLSDLLRSQTGESAQNHIQHKLIEKAKDLLSRSELSVAEIAYQLGFEQPQSLNRLFKKKTEISPLEFRRRIATS